MHNVKHSAKSQVSIICHIVDKLINISVLHVSCMQLGRDTQYQDFVYQQLYQGLQRLLVNVGCFPRLGVFGS